MDKYYKYIKYIIFIYVVYILSSKYIHIVLLKDL